MFLKLMLLWAIHGLLPTLVLMAFLNRRIRAVGPSPNRRRASPVGTSTPGAARAAPYAGATPRGR